MIQTFSNQDAYAAAGKPTDESRVALIEDINAVKIDGVNVLTDMPEDGDVVFEDTDDSIFYVKRTTVNKNLINASWTHTGFAFSNNGRQVKVLDKTFPSTTYQWLACWQYAITAISSTSITIKLRMAGDYANYVEIPVALTSAAINATTVSEVNAALEAAGNTGNVGYANHGYWAFLADANGNKVDSDGTQIIIQCDFNGNYQQFNVAGTGCTIALSAAPIPRHQAVWQTSKKAWHITAPAAQHRRPTSPWEPHHSSTSRHSTRHPTALTSEPSTVHTRTTSEPTR